ncbi:MAG TPA: hypothetical protein VKZ81_22410 [Pseudonocardia sp.]|jgi:hypothetical protein|uniref:hypothetical protein n=1 Tax=Pseudonocardia sp. TaxID=60912 RepID=UPI002B4AE728|nr:hypothetical protein [Pseudonocardia sp.]HLU58221.1 hypothetical protein [Pseudonocardia sp.]
MSGFLAATVSFPAVLLSFLLVVVVLYWLLVLVGADFDLFDGDAGADGADGADGNGGVMDTLGLGGVPLMVALSLWITLSWLLAMIGTIVLGALALAPAVDVLVGSGVLLVALLGGLLVTRFIVVPIRRALPSADEPTRSDFVGRICVIRTGHVSDTFGQAEITAEDGSSAIVQVRRPVELDGPPLRAGSEALIIDYDADREIFWVDAAPSTRSTDNSTKEA